MVALEFSDREDVDKGDVRSWVEMKRKMRARFEPKHYRPSLFDKL
jgi:hypothetical protein